VLYFGSPTGRDGIHGASFASEELSDRALERRGAVQVGDPFMGKKILEATLELIERGLVVGIQDMGAAGLTCSTCEMAARAETGIEIDLDRAPQRAKGMSAYELLLSESQERMLAVCEPAKVAEALAVCERWECGGAIVGEVTGTHRMVIRHRGEVVADLPVDHLTHGAPVYHPAEASPPPPPPITSAPEIAAKDVNATLLALLASPTVASKRWVYRRYDHMVQTGTAVRPGDGDAAVLRVRGEGGTPDRFLAVTSGGNHRYVARDAFTGGALAVCEAARNLVCVGAEPLGVTNCLNFGSPERPEVFGAFRRCVEGIAAACRALGVPVTGGNVSFYNESNGLAIPPTPMIGMVGALADPAHITRPGWRAADDVICVLGPPPAGLGGSELAKRLTGTDLPGKTPMGPLGDFDLEGEARLQRFVLDSVRAGLIQSAHDVSEGGLAVTLAECCLLSPGGLGAEIDAVPGESLAEGLFGELPPRVIVSVKPEVLASLDAGAADAQVDCAAIGAVVRGGLDLVQCGSLSLEELRSAHERNPLTPSPSPARGEGRGVSRHD
jgi:phosphoribosylformylglycinamidine synthase II